MHLNKKLMRDEREKNNKKLEARFGIEIINFALNKAILNGLKIGGHEKYTIMNLLRKVTSKAQEEMLHDHVTTLLSKGIIEDERQK